MSAPSKELEGDLMAFNQFMGKYIDFINIVTERNALELKSLGQYLKMVEFLNPDISDLQKLGNLINEYLVMHESEDKALKDFLKNLETLNSASDKEDELKSKITDLIEKIQSKSIDQIQEQIEK